MNTATATRDASYHQLTDLGEKQAAVFAVIAERGPTSNRAIAETLGWDVNRVTPRVFELRERGLVVGAGVTFDAETGRNVTLWGMCQDNSVPLSEPYANSPAETLQRPVAAGNIVSGLTPHRANDITPFELKARATKALGRALVEADKAARDAGLTGFWIELYRLVAVATTLQELGYAAKVIARYKVAKYPQYQIVKALGEQRKKELC